MITVYGVQLSPFVRKVLISLDILAVDYTLKAVNIFDLPEEFKRISPLGKVPVLDDDGFTIPDSTVICQYLNEKYASNKLYPVELKARTKVRWLEEYADTKLISVLGIPLFFERLVKPKFLKQQTDEQRVEENIKHYIPPVLDYLESVLPEAGFVCETLSVADVTIGSFFLNASYADYEVDRGRWPKLASYVARVYQQPVFQKYIESDKKILQLS